MEDTSAGDLVVSHDCTKSSAVTRNRERERVDGAAGRSEACASPGTTHPQWRHADCPRPGHWTGSRAGELYGKQQGAKLSLRKGRWEGYTCCIARHNARVGTCDQPRAASPLTYPNLAIRVKQSTLFFISFQFSHVRTL